jgi:thiol-disulfide isomerase/thioredoxin
MKFPLSIALIVLFSLAAFAQNEIAPVVEREFGYQDWTYKNLEGDGETNLRKFATGKKLVMVVYWAPWCPNWRHDVAFVQELHTKYADKGLSVIGVGEYDTVDRMRSHAKQFGLTFFNVYESESTRARETTQHYTQRRAAGDTRRWGSPWYVFLEPASLKPTGEVLADKVNVVNGELVKGDVEKFIEGKLGLSGTAAKPVGQKAETPPRP